MANLRIDNVVKSYVDNTVVHGVSCDIAAGEFIVIVGPSGCGKSTLLRMIAGLEPVSAGRIWMDGRDVTNDAAADRGIAMVFQSYALYPHMTVRDNMSFALRNLRRSAQEIAQKVAAAAQLLRLDDLLDRLPSQLSGGQRQRVAIGRAIVREPQIFLFDEPLSNLDAELRMQMRRELGKLHQRLGSTMVYVTHDQTEAMTLADRILLLNQGRIVQFGTPLELYNQPNDLFAAGFIGSPRINLVQGEVREAGGDDVTIGSPLGARWLLARARLGGLSLPAPVTLGIRPEHWHLERAPGDLEVAVTVSMVETLGDSLVAYATLDDGSEVVVKLAGQGALVAGERARLFLALGDILLFHQAGRRIALQPG